MNQGITRFQVLFMTATCILVAGNLYYNQPLLGILAAEFGVSDQKIALIPSATLIGYALGIVFLLPLGDMIERRKLLSMSMAMAGSFAVLIGFSQNFYLLCVLSFLLGVFNIAPSVLVPFSADLAKPRERGKVVGTVLSGILIGSLLARTLAGFIGTNLGWRAAFFIAGTISLILSIVTQFLLPSSPPRFRGSYASLLRSTVTLVKEMPLLREAAWIGAILFGTFSAFWTTLTFLLSGESFHYSSSQIGLFGIAGIMGALAAPLAGRYADRKGTSFTIRMGLGLALLAFVILALSSAMTAGLIIGVLLLDLGVQVAHISNQSRVFEPFPEARSRINSVYIFSYFTGGSLGSYIGSQLWSFGGWVAVCCGGFLFSTVAGLLFLQGEKARKLEKKTEAVALLV
jgi:predicted MFS family arabinose efflux permease